MKKAFLGIFTLLCLTSTLIWAMENDQSNDIIVQNDTITFEPNGDDELKPLAMTVIKSPRDASLYRLNTGDRSVYTSVHPFTFVIKHKDDLLENPEVAIVVLDEKSEQHYVMPLEFTYAAPRKFEIALEKARILPIQEPIIAPAAEKPAENNISTSASSKISYFLKFPVVALALFGGYQAVHKGTTWYKNSPWVKEKRAVLLQKLKRIF